MTQASSRLALLLGVLVQPAFLLCAADPPGPMRSPSSGQPSLRDVQRTIHARKALHEDEVLAPLNLSVHVRDGVAVVWGPIPSMDHVRRAIAKLEKVPGVNVVRSEMYVAPVGYRFEALTLPLHSEPPIVTQSASPNPLTGAIGTLTGRNPEPRRASESPKIHVSLLAPIGIADRVSGPAPDSPASSLDAAVERLRGSEARFRTIAVEVRGDTVYLRGSDASGEQVIAFAQVLSRLPGVERVVVRNPAR